MSLKTRLEKLEKDIIKDDLPDIRIDFIDALKGLVNSIWFIPKVDIPRLNEENYELWIEKYKNMDKNSNEFIEWKDEMSELERNSETLI